jgi:RNA polymerase sigma factor (sigma-70 family)
MNIVTTQLYPALLRQAAFLLMGSSASLAMQPADLLHSAVEKICRSGTKVILEEPKAFSGLVRTVMQRTLVDEHRRSSAARRPPPALASPLDEAAEIPAPENTCADTEDVHIALNALAAEDPEAARVVRGLFLEDKTTRELAAELRISPATVSRRWSNAAAWLRRELAA